MSFLFHRSIAILAALLALNILLLPALHPHDALQQQHDCAICQAGTLDADERQPRATIAVPAPSADPPSHPAEAGFPPAVAHDPGIGRAPPTL